ncbi:cytolysin [Daedaleopsis nitida]|nr:cytolysin [Daedaleopsis nitida]
MPTGPKTTWTDLSNLGWYKQDVFNALNGQRGGTMRNDGDMELNEGLADKYGWYCYNALRGDVRADGPVFNDLPHDDTIMWKYDNTKNSQPHEEDWSEKWSETRSASLGIKESASISLNTSVTIEGICSTEFGFSVSTESNKEESKEQTHELSHTWKIKVNPGETVSLVRTQKTRLGTQTYYQDFGLDPQSNKIATDGNKWDGHFFWGLSANNALNNPKGTMKIVGTVKEVTFTFAIVRDGKNGSQMREAMFMPPSPLMTKDETKAKVGRTPNGGGKTDSEEPEEMQAPVPGGEREED